MSPHYFPHFHLYADHDLSMADGYVNVSDRPGLGIDVKEADIAVMDWDPMPYRQYRHGRRQLEGVVTVWFVIRQCRLAAHRSARGG